MTKLSSLTITFVLFAAGSLPRAALAETKSFGIHSRQLDQILSDAQQQRKLPQKPTSATGSVEDATPLTLHGIYTILRTPFPDDNLPYISDSDRTAKPCIPLDAFVELDNLEDENLTGRAWAGGCIEQPGGWGGEFSGIVELNGNYDIYYKNKKIPPNLPVKAFVTLHMLTTFENGGSKGPVGYCGFIDRAKFDVTVVLPPSMSYYIRHLMKVRRLPRLKK